MKVQIGTSSQPPRKRSRFASCLIGCAILAAALAGLVGILAGVLAVVGIFVPDAQNLLSSVFGSVTGIPVPETRAVTGDATRFDPIGQYGEALAFAGEGALLIELSASYVKSDGTVDLTATSYNPWITYRFIRPSEAPADAPPIGAASNDGGAWYEPATVEAFEIGQRRQQTTTRGSVRSTVQWVNKGLTRHIEDRTTQVKEVLPAPQCSFAKLWSYALEEGAPRDAVAIISYDASGYSFSISGAGFNFDFDLECKPR